MINVQPEHKTSWLYRVLYALLGGNRRDRKVLAAMKQPATGVESETSRGLA